MSEIKGSDRVNIEDGMHEIYKSLSDKSSQYPESAPFFLMKDVFMWAVALGVRAGKRRELIGGRTQIFRWDQFSQDLDIPSLKAIALAETGDVDILLKEDEILRIAEEYANEGVRHIKQDLLEQPAKALWNLIDLCRIVE
jgi:dnd system-associated protein 4